MTSLSSNERVSLSSGDAHDYAPLHSVNSHSEVPALEHLHSLSPHGSPQLTDNERIRLALKGLRFGHVTIVVHNGAVVQIDRVEQLRVFRAPRR